MKVGDLVKMDGGGGHVDADGNDVRGYGIVVGSDHDGQWIHVSWSRFDGSVKRHFYKDCKVVK